MTESEFVKAYVAAFIGAWAAQTYHIGCAVSDWTDRIVNPPIEDAVFQAKETWKKCVEVCPKYFVASEPIGDRQP